jgi:hypothetical protein
MCGKYHANFRRVILEIQVPGKLTDERHHHLGRGKGPSSVETHMFMVVWLRAVSSLRTAENVFRRAAL